MATYTVKFVNDKSTKQTWTMAIYQTIPNMGLFDNVSWKQASAPQSGSKSVMWELKYNAALADFFSEGDLGVYESSQILDTDLGKAWQVVNPDGTQQLVPADTTAPAGYIYLINNSGRRANMGIGMSDAGSIYQRETLSGTKAEFKVTPKYYAALFNNVVVGEVISTAVSATDPVEILFEGGITSVTLTAWVEGETLHFGDKTLANASIVSTSMARVNRRLEANRLAHAPLAARQQRQLSGE